MDVVETA